MSTATTKPPAATEDGKVTVVLELTVTVTMTETVKNALDHKRVIDQAVEARAAIETTALGFGGSGTLAIAGEVKIGKHKIPL